MAMSELKQRLLKYELAQLGFPGAEYIPASDKIKVQPDDDRMPDINNTGDIHYGTEHSGLVLNIIGPLVSKVNEAVAAWKSSRPSPFEDVSHYNILAEYNNVVLAARDDAQYGRGLYYVTWRYNADHTGFDNGFYTGDYGSAKESFVTRSGLVQKEKLITREQAVDIKAAVNMFLENCPDDDLAERLSDIDANLCHVYPEIKKEAETERPRSTETPQKGKPSIQDALEIARQEVAKINSAREDGDKSSLRKRKGQGQEVL